MRKKLILVWICLLAAIALGGCKWVRIEEEEKTPVTYTIAKQTELPEELLKMIEEKKGEEFFLSCSLGEDLYLVRGYGVQMSGGYSIRVEELSKNSSALFFYTSLEGPKTPVLRGEPSYPYIAVKTKNVDLPVKYES